MSEQQPWLGMCHLTKEKGESSESYETRAAVWCADRDGFDAALRPYLAKGGYQLLWSEEVHPAGQWMSRHPRERDTIALAPKVHEGHRVEVGIIRSTGTDGEPAEPESYLIVEEIEGVEPLDGQAGAWPLKNVPDALMEPLFGDIEPTEAEIKEYGSPEAVPQMKTYAILDAGKIMFGLSVIEDCEMPFRCLFKGDAAEELQDVAPYIIELSPDMDFTRTLFTHDPNFPENHSTVHLWHKEPGIYIRSRATLDDLWKNFRKFTRLYSKETNSWRYFRFYAPETLRGMIAHFDETQFEKFAAPCYALFGSSENSGMIGVSRREAAQPADKTRKAG